MKKKISIMLCLCILMSCLCTSHITASASASRIKVGKYYVDYGRYVDLDDNVAIYLYKDNKYKAVSENSTGTGTWKVKMLYDFFGENTPAIELKSKKYNSINYLFAYQNNGICENQSNYDYIKAPSKPKTPKLSKGSNYIKVSWKKVNWTKNTVNSYSAKYVRYGYGIQYSTNKNFKNKKL